MDTLPTKSDIKPAGAIRGQPRHRIILDSTILVAGTVFFALTSPRGTPSLLLLAGFLVIALLLVALLDLLLSLTGLRVRIGPHRRRGLYLVVTVVPIVLLLMQSLGQLSVRDAAVVLLVTVIGSFYISSFRRSG